MPIQKPIALCFRRIHNSVMHIFKSVCCVNSLIYSPHLTVFKTLMWKFQIQWNGFLSHSYYIFFPSKAYTDNNQYNWIRKLCVTCLNAYVCVCEESKSNSFQFIFEIVLKLSIETSFRSCTIHISASFFCVCSIFVELSKSSFFLLFFLLLLLNDKTVNW